MWEDGSLSVSILWERGAILFCLNITLSLNYFISRFLEGTFLAVSCVLLLKETLSKTLDRISNHLRNLCCSYRRC